MKKAVINTFIFVFLVTSVAFAEISIEARVDKTRVLIGEVLTYEVSISSNEKQTLSPQAPNFTGFNVLSRGQSSALSMSSSGLKTVLIYTFILSPIEEGRFTIEPSTINIKNKKYSTDSFEIEVVKGEVAPKQPQPEEEPAVPQKPQPESEEPQITL